MRGLKNAQFDVRCCNFNGRKKKEKENKNYEATKIIFFHCHGVCVCQFYLAGEANQILMHHGQYRRTAHLALPLHQAVCSGGPFCNNTNGLVQLVCQAQ